MRLTRTVQSECGEDRKPEITTCAPMRRGLTMLNSSVPALQLPVVLYFRELCTPVYTVTAAMLLHVQYVVFTCTCCPTNNLRSKDSFVIKSWLMTT